MDTRVEGISRYSLMMRRALGALGTGVLRRSVARVRLPTGYEEMPIRATSKTPPVGREQRPVASPVLVGGPPLLPL